MSPFSESPNLTSLGIGQLQIIYTKLEIVNLLHKTSGFGVIPASQDLNEGSKTRVQYSRDKSICIDAISHRRRKRS
jgi:hypothetical protein